MCVTRVRSGYGRGRAEDQEAITTEADGWSRPDAGSRQVPVYMLNELPTTLDSVTLARLFVRGHLSGAGLSTELTAAAELLTSEVVTNAVKYGRPPVCVMVEVRPRLVHVSVSDTSPEMPARRQPGADSVGGGGLWVLDATARSWGAAPAEVGKTVWFDLEVPPASGG